MPEAGLSVSPPQSGGQVLDPAERPPLPFTVEIPERPLLAPHVQLMGAMPGTGFTDRQWLLQRDGRFLQVTEVLYRIAEHADGQHTLTEIAEAVTQATDWMVEVADVRQLLQRKLVPLGLIASAEGGPSTAYERGERGRISSPLALSLRMQTLSPRLIEPLTRLFQVFYEPFLLFPLVLVAGLFHRWLYYQHGLIKSIEAALQTPGGLLLTLALVCAAGMFHELGHAAALRYGGGKVRGMGIGLYLLYPVLYTDVTDSYRLDRWARVRTDLGGIYFHLLFALGLIVCALTSGYELLLFAVVLINLEMLHQLLPLVRLDGYWLLADLTGIPDFFSQAGPFLRSMVSTPKEKGDTLPALKPWVKGVFGLYLFLVGPLLGYLFFRLLADFPQFLFWTADAFVKQTHILAIGQTHGDLSLIILASAQMLLLVLPVIGAVYMIVNVSYSAGRVLWRWSTQTMARRMVGTAGAAVVLGSLLFLWALQPQGLLVRHAPQPPTKAATALLLQARDATAALHSLQAELEGALGEDSFTGTLTLQRPNLARVEITGSPDMGAFLVISDGQQHFVYFPADDQYTRSRPDPEGHTIRSFVAEQVEDFFRPTALGEIAAGGTVRYVGQETLEDGAYEVVEVETNTPRKKTTRYFIAPQDHLVYQVVTTTERKDGATRISWARLKRVQPNAAVEETIFRWTPPPTARPLQMPGGVSLPSGKVDSP